MRKVGQLLHQVGPVVGDRVLGVMTKLLDGIELKAALAQVFEKHAVCAGWETVAVREDDAG
jgi:hypothetical protein